MASKPTAKERVLDALRRLPPDATVEDAMEKLYFLGKVERGLEQADSGEVVSHQEARHRVNEWRG